jgi:uncharacterized protein (DUF697 family)
MIMQPLTQYEQDTLRELEGWKRDMQRRPGLFAGLSRRLQQGINNAIPEKVHSAITAAFRVVTRFLLRGADFLTAKPLKGTALQEREEEVRRQVERYKYAATAEGAITGAGGILLGLADLPLWLTIKIKMLSHIAALYGHDPGDFRERLFIMYVLSLGFSSRKHRRKVYRIVENWDVYVQTLPENEDAFDWRTFQQEYRDFLDIAKLLQLVPVIGAAVGAVVNNRLTDKLGEIAMNAYRMRWFRQTGIQQIKLQ